MKIALVYMNQRRKWKAGTENERCRLRQVVQDLGIGFEREQVERRTRKPTMYSSGRERGRDREEREVGDGDVEKEWDLEYREERRGGKVQGGQR